MLSTFVVRFSPLPAFASSKLVQPAYAFYTLEVSTSRLVTSRNIAYTRVARHVHFELGFQTYATAEIHLPERCISNIRSLLSKHDDEVLHCEVSCSQRKYACLAPELLVRSVTCIEHVELMAERHAPGSSDSLKKPAKPS